MRRLALVFTFLSFASLFVSCGGDEGGSSGGTGNVSVALLSPALASRKDSGRVTLSACSPNFGSGPVSGKCFTPLRFVAKATEIDLSAATQATAGVRIINMAAAPDNAGFEGPFGVLGLAEFDFAETAAVTNEYSDDNIQDETSTSIIYDVVSVTLGAAEMQIEIPSTNGNVTQKFWTIRYPFVAQSPLDLSTFSSCPNDNHFTELMGTDGHIYDAPSGFLPGDMLVCQKSSQTDSCADSDFKFIDSTSGALSTSRPGSPVSLSNSYWMDDAACDDSSEHPQISFGSAGFHATVSNPFKISKVIDKGTATYTHTADCTVATETCTGSTTTANKITVSISFDLENGVFVESSVDLENDTEANILKNLTKVLPKNFYRSANAAAEGDVSQDVQITATVSVAETR